MNFSQKYIISTPQTHFEKSGQLADWTVLGQLADRTTRGFLEFRQKYRFSRSEFIKTESSDEN